MPVDYAVQVPADLLESAARRYLKNQAIRISDCRVKELETDSYSGNAFYNAQFLCRIGETDSSVAFVIKRCNPDCWTSVLTDARSFRESLAWEHGLLASERAHCRMCVFNRCDENNTGKRSLTQGEKQQPIPWLSPALSGLASGSSPRTSL